MDPIISIRGLQYSYPDGTHAVKGIDFDLYPGESVVLLGANGSGKTTFILHLNGLLKGEGSITVCGLSPSNNARKIRRRVGMVFQDSDDQLFMPTVLDDVAFGPENRGLTRNQAEARARQALDAAGYTSDPRRAPYHLSAGEKRRVAIAGVLAMDPEVLVLDEPTTFLDPPGQRDLLRTLETLPQAKIIATHDVQFAAAIGTRAVFFEAGRIIAEGSVNELVDRFNWQLESRRSV